VELSFTGGSYLAGFSLESWEKWRRRIDKARKKGICWDLNLFLVEHMEGKIP